MIRLRSREPGGKLKVERVVYDHALRAGRPPAARSRVYDVYDLISVAFPSSLTSYDGCVLYMLVVSVHTTMPADREITNNNP